MPSLYLFVNIAANQLITGLNNPAIIQASGIPFRCGDTVAMNVYLFTPVSLPTPGAFPFRIVPTTGLQLQLYIDDGTQNGTIYTQQISWTSDPTNSFFSANLALNTAGIVAGVEAGGVSGLAAYLMLGYISNGLPTTVLDQPCNIGVGLPTSGIVVPVGQTPLSAEVAAATYVPQQGKAGQSFTLQSVNGHKIQLACIDNPDGTHSFQTLDLG